MLTREVRIAVPLFEREVEALRALVPPRRDAVRYQRLLSHIGPEDREVHAMLHAMETRQWRRAVLVARQLDRRDKQDDPLLRKLGLRVCAQDSS